MTVSTLVEQELVDLARAIVADGKVDLAEIKTLQRWLRQHHDSDVASVQTLAKLLDRITADRKVDAEEQQELLHALHQTIRELSQANATQVTCTGCGRRYRAQTQATAQQLPCDTCGTIVVVPALDDLPIVAPEDMGQLDTGSVALGDAGSSYQTSPQLPSLANQQELSEIHQQHIQSTLRKRLFTGSIALLICGPILAIPAFMALAFVGAMVGGVAGKFLTGLLTLLLGGIAIAAIVFGFKWYRQWLAKSEPSKAVRTRVARKHRTANTRTQHHYDEDGTEESPPTVTTNYRFYLEFIGVGDLLVGTSSVSEHGQPTLPELFSKARGGDPVRLTYFPPGRLYREGLILDVSYDSDR